MIKMEPSVEQKVENIPLLELRNIHKFYGKIHALKGIDLKIYEGEVIGLIGDNGAGKSTLVKIIAGVISKDKGEIYYKGQKVDIKSVKDARKLGIETAFQEMTLIDSLDVGLNIFLGRELTNPSIPFILDYKTMHIKSREILSKLGLKIAESTRREVRFLSGGERQGIVVARAMLFKSKLVILDEPTRNLSVAGVKMVLDFIRDLKKEGIACIFISHTLHHVYDVADRIVLLSRGEKLLDVPKHKYTLEELENMILQAAYLSESRI
ncbi:MAG: ATP-binding cassette domain-containing protein [Candidatus Verstraetearchaeota archaeon]|jgi:simple sugar transport system ATP-binding protein|nr:ATP-binding cassette domain-containing protein [Candidatus Verstraetearchaeota archaeon]